MAGKQTNVGRVGKPCRRFVSIPIIVEHGWKEPKLQTGHSPKRVSIPIIVEHGWKAVELFYIDYWWMCFNPHHSGAWLEGFVEIDAVRRDLTRFNPHHSGAWLEGLRSTPTE